MPSLQEEIGKVEGHAFETSRITVDLERLSGILWCSTKKKMMMEEYAMPL
jgi:hypothetical protein